MVFEVKGRNIYVDDFTIKFEQEDLSLTLELPTEGQFNKIFALATIDESKEDEAMNSIDEVIAMILNANKEKREIDIDFVTKNFDIPEKPAFLMAYFEWIKGIKTLPNLQSLAAR